MGSDSSHPGVAASSALACMSRSHLDCAVWPQKRTLILKWNLNKIELRLSHMSNDRPRCLPLPTAEYACCCLIIATACLRRIQLSANAKRHRACTEPPVTPSTQKCLQFSLAALSRQRRCLSPSLIFVQYADIIQMHFKSPIIVASPRCAAPPIIAVSTVNRNLHL